MMTEYLMSNEHTYINGSYCPIDLVASITTLKYQDGVNAQCNMTSKCYDCLLTIIVDIHSFEKLT